MVGIKFQGAVHPPNPQNLPFQGMKAGGDVVLVPNDSYIQRLTEVHCTYILRIIVTHWSSTTFGMLKARGALLDKGKIIF
jgi:hypothetical protein